MNLAFGDRLGLAALIVALFSLTAFYLWPTRKWIGWLSLILAAVLALGWGIVEIKGPEKKPSTTTSSTAPSQPPQQDLSGIQNSLDEINKNLSRSGRPRVSADQMNEIRQIDQLITSRDESTLRQTFGFPLIMSTNIRMIRDRTIYFKSTGKTDFNLSPYQFEGGTMLLSDEEGEVRRQGGGFVVELHPDRVSLIMLPREYSEGKRVLLGFENSSELPVSVVGAVKDFDLAVEQNSNDLIRVLSSALKENQDYYLQYENYQSSYFHKIDAMWLDKFVQLRPKADKIRDAIRQFLGVR